MIAQKLITQIQELGYRFELVGDNIKFTYTKGGRTPKEAIPILMQVKEHKQEVIGYLKRRPLKDQDAIDKILAIFNGRVVGVRPPNKPKEVMYEPTESDFKLDEYVGKPSMNPNGYKCMNCSSIGERYCHCLGLGHGGKWYWGWQCLGCRPYTEPERN